MDPHAYKAVKYLDTLPFQEVITLCRKNEPYLRQAEEFIQNDIINSDNYKKNIYCILSRYLQEICNRCKNDLDRPQPCIINDSSSNNTAIYDSNYNLLYTFYVEAIASMLRLLEIEDIYYDIVNPIVITNIKDMSLKSFAQAYDIDESLVMNYLLDCILDQYKKNPMYNESNHFRTICNFIHKLLPRKVVKVDNIKKEIRFRDVKPKLKWYTLLSKLILMHFVENIGLAMMNPKVMLAPDVVCGDKNEESHSE